MGIFQKLHDEIAAVHTPKFLAALVTELESEFEALKARIEALEKRDQAAAEKPAV